MKSFAAIFCLVVVLIASQSCFGQEPAKSSTGHSVEFNLKPIIGFTSGSTKFVMDVRSWFGPDITGGLKSELEYPLGGTLGGLQLGIGPRDDSREEWGIVLTFLTNLNSPDEVMKDHDWLYVPGTINAKIGYTESRAEMTATQFSLEGTKAIWKNRRLSIGLLGGFRYQKFSQNIFGYDGWYARLDTNNLGLPIYAGQDAVHGAGMTLTYKVTYKMPLIGFYNRINPTTNFGIMWKMAFAPVFANDVDDHVLRNRVAKSHGNGNAFIAGLQASVRPFRGLNLAHTFIQVDLDYLSLAVKTSGNQTWYGDDPASEGFDDTGTTLTHIPHNFYSRQTTASVRAGITF